MIWVLELIFLEKIQINKMQIMIQKLFFCNPYLFSLLEKINIKVDYSISEHDLSNPGSVWGSIIADEVNEGNKSSSSLGYMFFLMIPTV